jgi:chorismate--pyruvate lyase
LSIRSQLFTRAPAWFPTYSRRNRRIPPPAESWLFETGSLTQRLCALCGPEFRVRLLRQDWTRPFAEELRALGLRESRRAVVREVLLQWGDSPLVAARSVIPAQTLSGVHRRLARLGTRPLGEILFADPRLEREALELADIDAGFWRREPADALAPPARTWGRRSLYTLGQDRLLVAEFFLPSLFAAESSR